VDPDSKRVRVTVTDGRGRPVPNGGLARWLAGVVPARVHGEIAIALVSDARIRALNQRFRKKNVPTDVLSFPADPDPGTRIPEDAAFLGDIVIATGVAQRQAREAGHGYAAELRVLALHGLLHLLGYDHDDPRDAGRMARVESRLRRKGGLRDGLIARTRVRRPTASHR
jgi:probable rRNA maturation factor